MKNDLKSSASSVADICRETRGAKGRCVSVHQIRVLCHPCVQGRRIQQIRGLCQRCGRIAEQIRGLCHYCVKGRRTSITFKSGRAPAIKLRSATKRTSICHCLSCTSSTTTCEIPLRLGSSTNLRRMIPVVQKSNLVAALRLASNRI
jgi:hypothetical protein